MTRILKSVRVLIAVLAGVVLMSSEALAVPSFSSAQLSTPGVQRSLLLPAPADSAPVVYLGTTTDPQSGRVVEGYAFIHYRVGTAKPPWADKGNGGGTAESCFTFLSNGAKWRTVEPWVVNPTNNNGLSSAFVVSNLDDNITKWEIAAGADVLGIGSTTSLVLSADTSSPDAVNEVYFGDIASPGAIAVTIVWGYFSGPPQLRELIEWDMVFDETDYSWSSSGEAGTMDFENIATHELGHSVGLGDLYDSVCSEQTMYGFADLGETKKRSLETGDVNGMSRLY